MSDDLSDGELTDALLDLVDTSQSKKKRKRPSSSSKSSSSKRHKRELVDSESDPEEPESEDDVVIPYPLEGKYRDEEDRSRILQLPEIEREELLAQRAEEKLKHEESFKLNQLVQQQNNGDAVSLAAKRKHVQRGATKTKSDKLAELKAKRKAKDERKKAGKEKGSPKRQGSVSSNDMDISSEEEDGEINKDEQLEERVRNAFEKQEVEKPAEITDVHNIQLKRDDLAKFFIRPWFEEYVKGCYVRLLVGNENGEAVYRLCEIIALGPECKPYQVSGELVNQGFELKLGKATKLWQMDRVSNSLCDQKEFDRYVRTCHNERVPLVTKRQAEKKRTRMDYLASQSMTESEVTAILARKAALQPNRNKSQQIFTERVRLQQERALALAREDFEEAKQLEAKLKALDESAPKEAQRKQEDTTDLFAKINERNRQRNLEAVRKAEAELQAKKRMERKALASGTQVPIDPSARLKTIPKLIHRTSRAGTPAGTSTPNLTPPPKASEASKRNSPIPSLSIPATAPVKKTTDFEASMMNIEIDLGDF